MFSIADRITFPAQGWNFLVQSKCASVTFRPSSWREFRRREFPKTTIAEALNLLLPARTKPKNPSYPLQPRSNPPRGTGTAQKSKAASTLSEPNAALAWSSRCRADKVPGGAAAWAVRG